MRPYQASRKYLPYAIFCSVALATIFLLSGKGSALSLIPDPGPGIPPDLRAYLEGCDTYGQSPAFVQWMAYNNSPSPVVTVPYGDRTVPLDWHVSGAVCYSNSAVTETQFRVVTATSFDADIDPNGTAPTGAVTDAVGDTGNLDFRPGFRTVGTYRHDAESVIYDNGSPLTQTKFIRVEVVFEAINHFTSGVYGCVNGPGGDRGGFNFGSCSRTTIKFWLEINVGDPPDECANISGLQNTVPAGYVKSGSDCLFPRPSCEASAVNAVTGQPFTMSVRITNNASVALDTKSVTYGSFISGAAGGESDDIAANNGRNFTSTSHTISSPTNQTITWTITYATLYGNQTVSCEAPLHVNNRPITCQILPSVPPNPELGQAFKVRVRVTNPNPESVMITAANYSVAGAGITGNNLTGSAVSLVTLPSGTSNELESAQNITISSVGRYRISWSVSANNGAGSSINCNGDGASEFIETHLLPPTCAVTSAFFGSGEGFRVRVSLTNENDFAPITVNSASYSINPTGQSGSGQPISGSSFPASLAGGTSIVIQSVAPPIIISAAGTYTVTWQINTNAGQPSGNCRGEMTISDQPFNRFYGNDVVSCGRGFVIGQGGYKGSETPGNYVGSASQLAVFAAGQIHSTMTGAQDNSRDSLWDLSFANTAATNASTMDFGGNFGSCVWTPDFGDLSTIDSYTNANLNSIPAGTVGIYKYENDSPLFGTLKNGIRIVLIVDGDLKVGNPGAAGKGIFYGNVSWNDVDEIPSLTVMVTGSIFIDGSTERLDGHYIASGDIYTCSDVGNPKYRDLSDAEFFDNKAERLIENCNNKLTVNGSLSASRIHFLRIKGTLFNGVPREAATSSNIAESIWFSPEAYLTEGGGFNIVPAASPKLDSLVARPPSF